MEPIRHGFPPVVDDRSRILVLGSFPSVRSRAEGFFYMHPRNRFWRILSDVFGADFIGADVNGRIRLLRRYGIALYDVVEECRVTGSGDASIRDVVYADIGALLAGTNIRRILLNGTTALRLFKRRQVPFADLAVGVPSTSPANAATTYEDLLSAWHAALLGR